jgi:hypothetical protein
MSVLDSARLHKKFHYKVVDGSMAKAITADEFDQLYPAQRGFVNRWRRFNDLPTFKGGNVHVELKAKPVKEQITEAVQHAREEEREPSPVVRSPKPTKPKRPKAKKAKPVLLLDDGG